MFAILDLLFTLVPYIVSQEPGPNGLQQWVTLLFKIWLHSANGVHLAGDLKEIEEWDSPSSFTEELLGADWVSLPKVTDSIRSFAYSSLHIALSHPLFLSLCLCLCLSCSLSLSLLSSSLSLSSLNFPLLHSP